MGADLFGIPRELAADLARALDLHVAVETGSHMGDSANELRDIFDRVWSMELSDHYFALARERHGNRPGLTFLHGSSADLLPKLVAELDEPALYWLDGHWCEGATAGEESQCPVMEEIAAIDQSDLSARSCILIDDARFFLASPGPPYRREDWPPLIDIVDALRGRFDRFVTVLQDVIISGPRQMRDTVDAYWLRVQHLALHDERDQLRAELAAARQPTPRAALRRLASSVVPVSVKRRLRS